MKRFFLLLLMSLVALLVACGGGETAVSNPEPAAVAPAEAVTNGDGGETAVQPITDLSLVANTGKLQFLNAYASW